MVVYNDAKVVLPKQWKHWCADSHLKPHHHAGGWMYLRGRGRFWRVNCWGDFQCGDTYADFDRWALCNIHEAPMPRTREQFREAVAGLLVCHAESLEKSLDNYA